METNEAELQRYTIYDTVRLSQISNKEEEKILMEPYNYVLRTGSEQSAPSKLLIALNYWLKISQDKLNAIGDIAQMILNSCLLLDDIQDNSVLRAGIPVAHNIYGLASAVNTAFYIMPIGLERVIELNHPEAVQIYAEQLRQILRGQGTEIYWRDNYICPTETAYKRMAIQKTGSLFIMMAKLMQLFSDYKKDVTILTGILGLYYQIFNDYSNLYLEEYGEDKGYCEDITEGKFSFPIMHAIQTNPESKDIMNILRQKTKDVELKRYCITLLKKFGSYDYTRTVLAELDKEVKNEIERLGGNPLLLKLVDSVLIWKHQNGGQQESKKVTL